MPARWPLWLWLERRIGWRRANRLAHPSDWIEAVAAGGMGARETMTDFAELESRVQPQHLEPARIESYRQAAQQDPLGLVVVDDFLQRPVIDRVHRWLVDEAIFIRRYGLYSMKGAERSDWLRASDEDRFFTYDLTVGVQPQYRMSPNWLTYLTLEHTLEQRPALELFSAIADVELTGTDPIHVHSHAPGDYLKIHNDQVEDRRLCGTLFLSPDWQPGYGGELCLFDQDKQERLFAPRYNRLILFDPKRKPMHRVAEHTPEAKGWKRFTLILWYSDGQTAASP